MVEKTKSRYSAKTAAYDLLILRNRRSYNKLNPINELVEVRGHTGKRWNKKNIIRIRSIWQENDTSTALLLPAEHKVFNKVKPFNFIVKNVCNGCGYSFPSSNQSDYFCEVCSAGRNIYKRLLATKALLNEV